MYKKTDFGIKKNLQGLICRKANPIFSHLPAALSAGVVEYVTAPADSVKPPSLTRPPVIRGWRSGMHEDEILMAE